MIRNFAAAAALFALAVPIAVAARAQAAQDSAKPSDPAQNSGPSSSSSTAANSAKPKSKKVWTNDNVPTSGEGVSVVGSAGTSKNTGSTKSQLRGTPASHDSVDPRVLASLRDQLRRLEAQLAVVDKQYSDLKAQSKGDSKSAGGLQQNTYAYDTSSVEEQLQRLQSKKKRLQSTIDDLLDAARKAGIEPGDLR
jgi:hypothetical protein